MVELHEIYPSHFLRVGLRYGLKLFSFAENLVLSEEYRNLNNKQVEMIPSRSYIVDLPDFPADAPLGCLHVFDLSQIDPNDVTVEISLPDIIATILFRFDKKYLKVFMDVAESDYEQVEFRIPGAIPNDEKGLLVLTRENHYVSATIIIPTPPTADATTADIDWTPDAIDRYIFSTHPSNPCEPWILEYYSHRLRARSAAFEDIDKILPAYEVCLQYLIEQDEVPWLNDVKLRELLSKRCWEDGSIVATGWLAE